MKLQSLPALLRLSKETNGLERVIDPHIEHEKTSIKELYLVFWYVYD